LKVLDTTFLVDVLRNVPGAIDRLRALEAEGPLATTEIVAYELYHGIQHLGRRRRETEAARIEELQWVDPPASDPAIRSGSAKAVRDALEASEKWCKSRLSGWLTSTSSR